MSEKYELIDEEKDARTPSGKKKYTVVAMCAWLGVSTAGYYDWRDRPVSATSRRRDWLSLLIAKAFTDSDETYGHRRIHAQLARWGVHCTPELARAIMRDLGLVPCQPRPWRHNLTEADPAAGPIPDLVNRDFTADAPNRLWITDITEHSTAEGKVYCAAVMDAYSRLIVGWSIADHMRTELVTDALGMAIIRRQPDKQPEDARTVLHSDHGSQYTSWAFGQRLRAAGLLASMGTVGDCYDNAMME